MEKRVAKKPAWGAKPFNKKWFAKKEDKVKKAPYRNLDTFDKVYETKDRLFLFKQKSQDFIVEEMLPFSLEGNWDAFYVYFEKTNKNTMDIINHLCKELGISRLTLWVAWLKDKNAMTRQRISIYKSALKKIWWERGFTDALSQVAHIIKTNRHTKPLWMTDPIRNMFHIRLRAKKNINDEMKEKVLANINELMTVWFPNYYWEQRFWINQKNPAIAKQLLSWKLHIKEKFEYKFKLQAYSSYLFNLYLKARIDQRISLVDGDILSFEGGYWIYHAKSGTCKIIYQEKNNKQFFYYPPKLVGTVKYNPKKMKVTGPLFWFNTLLCPIKSKARQLENFFMRKNDINEKTFKLYQDIKLFWLRRNMRVNPKHVNIRFQWDDLILSFSLPWWTYASILIDEIMKCL